MSSDVDTWAHKNAVLTTLTPIQTEVTLHNKTNNSSTGCSPYASISLHSATSINDPHHLQQEPKEDINRAKRLSHDEKVAADRFYRIVMYIRV